MGREESVVGVVYRIMNNELKLAYIGSTIHTFDARYGTNWWETTHNELLKSHVLEYGLRNFSVDIIKTVEENLEKEETEAIISHDSIFPHGYNQKYPIQPSAERLDLIERTRIRRTFYSKDLNNGVGIIYAVKTFRKIVGKNQEDFAKMQKIPLRTLQEIEQGRANPTLKTLEKALNGSGLEVGFIKRQ